MNWKKAPALKYNHALKIALSYALVGFLWILFSDQLVELIFQDSGQLNRVQTYKGWFFVAVTGTFLYVFLMMQFKAINETNKTLNVKNEELTVTTEELIAMEDELQSRLKQLDQYAGELKGRNEFINQIYNGINGIIMVWHLDGRIIETNRFFNELVSYEEDEIVGKTWSELFLDPEGQVTFNLTVKQLVDTGEINNYENDVVTKSGTHRRILWNDRLLKSDAAKEAIVISFGVDITDSVEKDMEINRLLYFDKTTQAPNAVKLELDCRHLIQKETPFTLILADIQQLGKINNQFGIKTGDRLIGRVYSYLLEIFNEDQVYKWHDGSFIILTPIIKREIIRGQMGALLTHFSGRMVIDGKELVSGLHIGLTQYPVNGTSFEQLIHYASYASTSAKNNNQIKYKFFSDQMLEELSQSIEAETKLAEALANDTLEIYLQPLFNIKREKIDSAEVLLRSLSENFYFESILDFIKIAERTGQIVDVDFWVIRKVFALCVANESIGALDVGVNLSAQTFTSMRFIPFLKQVLSEYPIQPRKIIFELTEHTVVEDYAAAGNIIEALKSMGFSIALDDFGSEYSSLKYISKLDFDCIKIDKAFIDDLVESMADREIVESIIRLGDSLKVNVVAEGVETYEQFQMLKNLGCTYAQGYLIAKPLTVSSMLERLKKYEIIR